MFENINKKNNTNKINLNEFMKDLPEELKNQLNMQENTLIAKNNIDSLEKNLSKYLANRTKRAEDDLLLNKTNQHRLKKEFTELILSKNINSSENSAPFGNFEGSLRNHGNTNHDISYAYYGDIYNPVWMPVKGRNHLSIDIVRNPYNKSSYDFKSFGKKTNLIDSINDNASSYNKSTFNQSVFNFNSTVNQEKFFITNNSNFTSKNNSLNEMIVKFFLK